jgi:hypothetical protein
MHHLNHAPSVRACSGRQNFTAGFHPTTVCNDLEKFLWLHLLVVGHSREARLQLVHCICWCRSRLLLRRLSIRALGSLYGCEGLLIRELPTQRLRHASAVAACNAGQ